MADLSFDDEPLAQLENWERDPSLAAVLAAVDDELDLLEADPTNSAVRPRRFTNGLWCVIAYDPYEDWAILWEPHPDLRGDVEIRSLGPATFD